MPGHYGLKKKNGPSKRTAKMTRPTKLPAETKAMSAAAKAALTKRLGKKK